MFHVFPLMLLQLFSLQEDEDDSDGPAGQDVAVDVGDDDGDDRAAPAENGAANGAAREGAPAAAAATASRSRAHNAANARATAHLSARAAPNPATCFHDGRRKIDFVLVYEESVGNGGATTPGGGAGEGGLLRSENTRSAKHEVWRQRFLDNLRRVGLEMEEVSRARQSCTGKRKLGE